MREIREKSQVKSKTKKTKKQTPPPTGDDHERPNPMDEEAVPEAHEVEEAQRNDGAEPPEDGAYEGYPRHTGAFSEGRESKRSKRERSWHQFTVALEGHAKKRACSEHSCNATIHHGCGASGHGLSTGCPAGWRCGRLTAR